MIIRSAAAEAARVLNAWMVHDALEMLVVDGWLKESLKQVGSVTTVKALR